MGTNKRQRHRAWPESLKREIVAATLLPGSSVSRVARRYDVNANQVFAWRRHYRDGAAEPAERNLVQRIKEAAAREQRHGHNHGHARCGKNPTRWPRRPVSAPINQSEAQRRS